MPFDTELTRRLGIAGTYPSLDMVMDKVKLIFHLLQSLLFRVACR